VLLSVLLSAQLWQIIHFTNRWILFVLMVALLVRLVLTRNPKKKLSQTKIILRVKRLLQCTVDLQRVHPLHPLLRMAEDRESFLNTI